MKLNYSKKILIISTVAFLVVLSADIIFTNMLLSKINSINDKIRQIDFSSQEREKSLSLKDSVLSSVDERAELNGYFIPAGNAETVRFTKYLEDLATSLGLLQKKTLNYEPVTELGTTDTVSSIRFHFIVSGKWNSVYNFVQLIETLPKVSRLNSVSLNYISDSKTWSADLDFSVVNLK